MNFESRSVGITVLAVVLLAFVAAGAWYVRRPPKRAHAPAVRPSPPVDELPEIPVRQVERRTEDRKETKPMEESHSLPDLSKDRGAQAIQMYELWMKARDAEIQKHLDSFGRTDGLPPDRVPVMKSLLETEEKAWRQDLERRLRPTFEGRSPPDYKFLEETEYKSFVERITGSTDQQASVLLDGARWDQYKTWRSRYNRRLYFFSEE